MEKSTAKMLEELSACSDFNRFYRKNQTFVVRKTLAQYLEELLKQSDLTKAEAIRRSELNDIYAYQIFSGVRVPERKKLLSLALGMGVNLDDTQNLLKCCGYAQLYVKNTFDCIVVFGICKKMNVQEVNFLLYDYGMETLG